MDRHTPVGLRDRERRSRLGRRLLDRPGPVDTLDDHIGLGERRRYVALADLTLGLVRVVEVDVAVRCDVRLVGVEGVAHVEKRGSLLEFDLDRLNGSERLRLRLGRDDSDQLADIAHLMLSEQRLVWSNPPDFLVADDVVRDV